MKFFDKDFKSERNEKIKVFLFGNTFLLLFVFLIINFYVVTKNFDLVLCPMKAFAHSICPFCGGTRCALYFFSLDFKESFFYHPTTFVLIIYVIFSEIVYIIDIITNRSFFNKIFQIDKVCIVYLAFTFIQYAIRLYCFYSNVQCFFMYTNV